MSSTRSIRNEFLSTFPAQYRDHIVEFARKLSKLDVDVLVLTARKTVCLVHCFEYFGMFSAGSRAIISERCLDHDRNWLAGKRVAIVDEVIVSGSTIYKLCDALNSVPVKSLEVHCLFVNREYFVSDFFVEIQLSPGYIRLENGDAQALSTAIVDAIHKVPRPYSVDYPMSKWMDVHERQLSRLMALPGWETVERHWVGRAASDESREIVLFRVTPRPEIFAEIDRTLGLNVSGFGLVKLRLYGHRDPSAKARYIFRVVPYVVLAEMDEYALNAIFLRTLKVLNEEERRLVVDSCRTRVSQLRLVQYVLSLRLAHEWVRALRSTSVELEFQQHVGELNFLFPATLHAPIDSLSRASDIGLIEVDWIEHQSEANEAVAADGSEPEIETQNDDVSPVFFEFSVPFRRMYFERELPFRRAARKHGRKIFKDPRYKHLVERLNVGLTLSNLRNEISRSGIRVSPSLMSDFLDLSIDLGVVVPITMERKHRGKTQLCRAYRHGEETYILERDITMFHAMLVVFASQMSLNSAKQDARSGRRDGSLVRLPKILIEKTLVLFMRYAIGLDILRSNHERLEPIETGEEKAIPLRVGFHKHGSRLETGFGEPTDFRPERAFVNLLVNEEILRKGSGDGYLISPTIKNSIDLDEKRKSASEKFGGTLAEVLRLPERELRSAMRDSRSASRAAAGSPSEMLDTVLVAMTSCETAVSTLLAVGAELRLACEHFRNGMSVAIRDARRNLGRLTTHFSRFYFNSALMKIDAHLDQLSRKTAEKIDEALSSHPLAHAVWIEIADLVVHKRSFALERDANHKLLHCVDLLNRLDFHVQLLTHALADELGDRERKAKSLKSMAASLERLTARASDLRSAGGARANHAFADKLEKCAIECSALLDSWRSRKVQAQICIRKYSISMNQLLKSAEFMYLKLDDQYRDRGILVRERLYSGYLRLSVEFDDPLIPEGIGQFDAWLEELRRQIARANSGLFPHSYRKRSASKAEDSQTLIMRQRRGSRSHTIEVFGDGPGVPPWFGYLTADFVAHTTANSSCKFAHWIVIAGLDESSSFSKADTSDVVRIHRSLRGLIEYDFGGVRRGGRAVFAGSAAERRRNLDAFSEELNRRSRGGLLADSVDPEAAIPELGAKVTLATYGRGAARERIPAQLPLTGPARETHVLVLATEWRSRNGGVSTFNRQFCRALVETGARVVCVVPEIEFGEREQASDCHVELHEAPEGVVSGDSGLGRKLVLPKGFHPTLVVGHSKFTGPAAKAQVADNFPDAKRIHFVHVVLDEVEPLKALPAARRTEEKKEQERKIAEGADIVVGVGELLAEESKSLLAGSKIPIHSFEPGLMSEELAEIPAQLKCLIVGRMQDAPVKGLDIAAEAMALVCRSFNEPARSPKLIIRGIDEDSEVQLRKYLGKIARGVNAELRTELLLYNSREEAITQDFRRASVVLMPSRAEGFGLMALESISMGVPTLISERSGLAEMLKKHTPEPLWRHFVLPTFEDRAKCSQLWATAIGGILRDKESAWKRASELREAIGKAVTWRASAQSLIDRVVGDGVLRM